jgi:hypothetical protein
MVAIRQVLENAVFWRRHHHDSRKNPGNSKRSGLIQVVHKRLERVDIICPVNTNTHKKIFSLPRVPPEVMPGAAAAQKKQNSGEIINKP